MSTSFSLVQAIWHADIVVKFVLFILICCSIGTWSIFFQKISSLKLMRLKNTRFEKKFWSGIMLEEFYQSIKSGKILPGQYNQIFCAAMEEWNLSDVQKAVMAVEFIKIGIRERVQCAMDNAKNRLQEKLNSGLGFLSIIASSSPFIGLFGTVWGVMNSFASLANVSSVTLSAVAPGISEALFATAIGLFVALPAIIFHHKIAMKIEALNSEIDNFSIDVHNVLSRELDNFSVRNYLDANRPKQN